MLLETLGIIAVLALVVTLVVRPGAAVAVALAVGVVGAAIVVSWSDVEQARAQRAADAAFQQENATVSAGVTVPSGNTARSGS